MWNGGSGTRGQPGFASGPKSNYAHQSGPRMTPSHAQMGGGPGGGVAGGANLDAMNWEELYDSGNLEVHLKTQLNLGAQLGVPPGPPPPIHPMYHGGQMGMHPSHMNGDLNRTSAIQPLMSIVTRPPMDCQVPPPPLPHQRIMMRPNFENYNNPPPPPIFTQPPPPILAPRGPQVPQRPVIMKRPQGSSPGHPLYRGSSSSSKYAPRNGTNSIQTAESDSNILVKPIEVEVISDHPRTQYRPPEPKVKILKRPSSTPSNLSGQEPPSSVTGGSTSSTAVSNGTQNSPEADPHKAIQTKSLKEREEEYNQARLRIFGSTEPSSGETVEESSFSGSENNPSKTPSSSNNNILRLPRGPDGTVGFKLKR